MNIPISESEYYKIEVTSNSGFNYWINVRLYTDKNNAFDFYFRLISDLSVKLYEFRILEKEDRKRKFNVTDKWDRHDKRESSIENPPKPPQFIFEIIKKDLMNVINFDDNT